MRQSFGLLALVASLSMFQADARAVGNKLTDFASRQEKAKKAANYLKSLQSRKTKSPINVLKQNTPRKLLLSGSSIDDGLTALFMDISNDGVVSYSKHDPGGHQAPVKSLYHLILSGKYGDVSIASLKKVINKEASFVNKAIAGEFEDLDFGSTF